MIRRLALFLALNGLILLTVSIVLNVLNVKPYLGNSGLDVSSLLIFCLVWGMVGAFISLALSRKIAKWTMRIRLIDPNSQDPQEIDLYRSVARLSRNANLPDIPEIGIFDSSQMNAFATGPTKRRSLVAVSTALLKNLQKQELEAVLAHEISHIANGDMVTMTLIQGVVNAFVMFLARILAYAVSTLGRSTSRRPSYLIYSLFVFLFEVLFMLLGSLLICAFSRWREFRADRGGAILTRKEFMIQALEKLQFNQKEDRRSNQGSLAALMITSKKKECFLLRWFSTHPSLESRIQRLQEM